MKYKVPVHVSMDLVVEVNGRKNPDVAQLRQAAEEAVEKKLQSMLAGSGRFTGTGRAKAVPTRATNEQGQLAFKQPKPRERKAVAERVGPRETAVYEAAHTPANPPMPPMPPPPDVDPPDYG